MAVSRAIVENKVASNSVVVFAKSFCPYSAKAKALLTELGVHFEIVDLDLVDNGADLQAALADITGQGSVPNVFIGGKSYGGNSDIEELHKNEKLVPLLKEVGAF